MIDATQAAELSGYAGIQTQDPALISRLKESLPETLYEKLGGMTLSLWISSSEGEDMDLFVLLRKWAGIPRCFSRRSSTDEGEATRLIQRRKEHKRSRVLP